MAVCGYVETWSYSGLSLSHRIMLSLMIFGIASIYHLKLIYFEVKLLIYFYDTRI